MSYYSLWKESQRVRQAHKATKQVTSPAPSFIRLLILILLVPEIMSLAQNPADVYTEKLEKFNAVYTPYVRKYFGCPDGARDTDECKPSLGVRDWKLEEEVIKRAEVFTK